MREIFLYKGRRLVGAEFEMGRAVGSLEAGVRGATPAVDPELLASVERRILWLATSVVHHANRVRPNRSVQSPVDLAGSGARYWGGAGRSVRELRASTVALFVP